MLHIVFFIRNLKNSTSDRIGKNIRRSENVVKKLKQHPTKKILKERNLSKASLACIENFGSLFFEILTKFVKYDY